MKILKIKEIELSNETLIIDLMGDDIGAQVGSQVCVQIDSTADIVVKGAVIEDGALEPIALIKLADMTVTNQITSAGIYVGDVSALTNIAFVGTGAATVKILVE